MSAEASYLAILATVETGRRFTIDDIAGPVEAAQLTTYERGKTCCDCGQSLPLSAFHRDRSARDGRVRRCKSCSRMRCASPEVRRREVERHRRTKAERPLYDTWRGIIRRCFDENDPAYQWYGARGVAVHEPWRDCYEAFEAGILDAIGPRPGRDYSIDRIDVDGHYAPGNLRWATAAQQAANRRDNRYVTYRGATRLSAHWAREFSLDPSTFAQRLKRGWDVERALTTPPRSIRTKKRIRSLVSVTEHLCGGE